MAPGVRVEWGAVLVGWRQPSLLLLLLLGRWQGQRLADMPLLKASNSRTPRAALGDPLAPGLGCRLRKGPLPPRHWEEEGNVLGASCLPASRTERALCRPQEPTGARLRAAPPLVSSVLGCGSVSVHSPVWLVWTSVTV